MRIDTFRGKSSVGLFLPVIIAAFLLSIPSLLLAEDTFTFVTDKTVILPVYGTYPVKGEVRVDPTTGVSLQRKTDYAELAPNSNYSLVVYSRYSPTNSSEAYVLVHGDNSTSSHIYRVADNVKVASLTLDGTRTIGELNEIRWDYSGNYPNRVYFVYGMKFYYMDVLSGNGNPILIHDFAKEYPEAVKIINDVEGDSSNDSRYWAWQVLGAYSNGDYPRLRIITYDRLADKVMGELKPSDVGHTTYLPKPNMVEISPLGDKVITHYGRCWGATVAIPGIWTFEGSGVWSAPYQSATNGNNSFNWVQSGGQLLTKMKPITADNQWYNDSSTNKLYVRLAGGSDPSYNPITVNYGARPEDIGSNIDAPRAWDLNFTSPVQVSVGETHSGWAFDASGMEYFVSQNNRTDWIEACSMSGTYPDNCMNVLYHGDLGWENGFHFGKIYNPVQGGWFEVSTSAKTNTNWGSNQLLMVELKPADQSPKVWRITPNYNQYAGSYRDEAPAALSHDGKSIWWTANWGNANGHGEVFQAKLPSDWNVRLQGNDIIPPTVSLNTPSNNVSISGTSVISASAIDNKGVTKVDFYVNENLVSSVSTAPYASKWDTTKFAKGSYALTAKAYDAAGNEGKSAVVTVMVLNDSTAPTVAIVSPSNGTIATGVVDINANAADDLGVTRVEFYVNNVLWASDSTAPFSYNWNTTSAVDGNYSLSAKAYDAAGNVGQSSSVAVTVKNSVVDAVAPVVTIKKPVTGAKIGNTLSVSASATDNTGVTLMQLFVDNVLRFVTSAKNFTTSMSFSSMPKGNHVVLVKAYDAAGNVGQKSVTVSK